MAFGSASAIFQYAMRNLICLPGYQTTAPTGMTSTGFLGDTMKFALYGNSGTPDKTVATAVLSSYGGSGSQWVTGNEITGTNYSAGGYTLERQGVGNRHGVFERLLHCREPHPGLVPRSPHTAGCCTTRRSPGGPGSPQTRPSVLPTPSGARPSP